MKLHNGPKSNILFGRMNNVKLLPSLVVFAEVVRWHSFTKAGQQLNMSKSSVSLHISRLEELIGSQLLLRNTRGMTLTRVGTELAEKVEFIQDQIDFAVSAATSAQEDPGGEFSITYPPLLEGSVVGPALLQLSVEFPKLKFRTLSTERPLDLFRDNLDVAIHAGTPPDSVYRALPMGVIKDHFYAATGYFRGEPVPTAPDELVNRKWIVPTWQAIPTEYFAAGTNSDRAPIAPLGTLSITPHATCTTLASLRDLSRQGLGICLMPELCGLPLVQSGDLVRIATGYEGRAWPFHFVHPYQGEKPIHVKRFYELLRRFFAKALIA